jgi:dephospho-CoA kinase
MEKKNIIAILGMPGSGKTEAIEYLTAAYHFPKVWFGSITIDEVSKRGLPLNPANERLVREELREVNGEDYYANEMIKMIDGNEEGENILVESLYSWTEFQVLKRHFGERLHTIAIYASPTLRHHRLTTRPVRPLTKEEAEHRDASQIVRLEQGGPIAVADYMVANEGELSQMTDKLDEIMTGFGFTRSS